MSMAPAMSTRASFLVSLLATLGSLFLGEVLKYPPCTLCWYQRICMYPVAVIFGVALWSDARDHLKYAIPLLACGLLISGYHNLLYYGVIPDSITPCSQGVSCTSKQIELLGFITIPLMALVSFVTLFLFSIFELRLRRRS